MAGECIYHFSGVRMLGTAERWPEAAVVYGRFFMWLWASASLLIALVLLFAAKNIDKSSQLIIFMGGFSFFHALVLAILSLQPLTEIWQATPATFVWFSGYTTQLKVEAALLATFGLYVSYGMLRKYLSFTS